MPNIAITNYCNLRCPYCFADNFIQTEKNNITLEELHNIFNFLKKEQQKTYRIGVIGGEPTIHPDFAQILKEIIKFSSEQKLHRPTVFSNGILLSKYSFFFGNEASVLLNLNPPEVIGKDKWHSIENTLKNLEYSQAFANNNVNFGINLYLDIPNWQYIFDLSKNYNQDQIRCSIVAPTCQFKDMPKTEYYTANKELFLNFLSDANKNNITVRMDCNRIPLCYFSEKEKEFILKQTKNYTSYCNSVVDISHDMKAVCCFGIDIPVDVNQFQNLSHLERYFQLKQMASLIEHNKIDKCKNCPKIDLLECYGGCLSFAK